MCPNCFNVPAGEKCSCGNIPKPVKHQASKTKAVKRQETIMSVDEFKIKSLYGERKMESLPSIVTDNPLALPEDFQKDIELAGFIPNIQLLQAQSDIVQNPPKDATNEPRPGHYWFGTNVDLGPSIDCIAFAAMTHALLVENRKLKLESFDHTSDDFKKIKTISVDRSRPQGVAARWGVDVLLYLPHFHRFGVYFFYSTARSVAQELTRNPNKVITLKSKIVRNKSGQSWWLPDPYVVHANIDSILAEMPDVDSFITKFKSRIPRQPDTQKPGDPAKDR